MAKTTAHLHYAGHVVGSPEPEGGIMSRLGIDSIRRILISSRIGVVAWLGWLGKDLSNSER